MEKIIDRLPDSIPSIVTDGLKKQLLGNKDLEALMKQVDGNRPPRIFMVGKTGIGKSSLVNALCGGYFAEVSNVNICTNETKIYSCKDNDRTLLEIMDSRGIDESESIGEISAEEQLQNDINFFAPDVVLLVLDCTNRSKTLEKDIALIQKIRKKYYIQCAMELPVIVVLNKADEVSPARVKEAENYPPDKIHDIMGNTERYRRYINKQNFKISAIVPVSSIIDWKLKNGEEISVEKIKNLPVQEIKTLEIAFDGRYNIDKLRDAIEDSIEDYEAKMGFRMALKLDELVVKIGNQINKILSGIASAVALTPIPISDIWILTGIQTVSVILIASLSGREISIKTAKEFIFSLSGLGATGLVFRTIAQQASKLANGIFPGAGSAISSAIASLGTYAIGSAAIEYYIEGNDMKLVKKKFKKEKQNDNQKQ